MDEGNDLPRLPGKLKSTTSGGGCSGPAGPAAVGTFLRLAKVTREGKHFAVT